MSQRDQFAEDYPWAEILSTAGEKKNPNHDKLRDFLVACRRASEDALSSRYDAWRELDEEHQLYIRTDQAARTGEGLDDPTHLNIDDPHQVVIPAQQAASDVRVSSLYQQHVMRDPILELEGVRTIDMDPARALQAVTEQQDFTYSGWNLVLWTHFAHMDRYGMAPIRVSWEEERGVWYDPPKLKRSSLDPLQLALLQTLIDMGEMPDVFAAERKEGVAREFVRYENVDPYNFWPDPGVSFRHLQSGQYCGDRVYVNAPFLERNSTANGGLYFNLQAINMVEKAARGRGAADGRRSDTRQRPASEVSHGSEKYKPPMPLDRFVAEIQPRAYGLSESDSWEKWYIEILDDEAIVRCHPLIEAHNIFPWFVAEIDPDPFVFCSSGLYERTRGLKMLIDLLVNTHMLHTVRSIHNALIYTPALFNERSLLHRSPLGHIKLTKLATRKLLLEQFPIRNMYDQLEQQDTTRGHVQDAMFLLDQLFRMWSTSDPQQGQPLPTRRTLGEVQEVLSQGTARVAIIGERTDRQSIGPAINAGILLRQQFTSMEMHLRLIGDDPLARQRLTPQLLYPEDLAGMVRYLPRVGMTPRDPMQVAENWIQIMQALLQAPMIWQNPADGTVPNIKAMIREIASAQGVRNFDADRFWIPIAPPAPIVPPGMSPEVLPNDQVAEMAARGELQALPVA